MLQKLYLLCFLVHMERNTYQATGVSWRQVLKKNHNFVLKKWQNSGIWWLYLESPWEMHSNKYKHAWYCFRHFCEMLRSLRNKKIRGGWVNQYCTIIRSLSLPASEGFFWNLGESRLLFAWAILSVEFSRANTRIPTSKKNRRLPWRPFPALFTLLT